MRHPADAFGMDPYSPAVSAILRVLEGFDPGEERSLGDLAVDIDAAARPIIEAEAADSAIKYMTKYGIRSGVTEPHWPSGIRAAIRDRAEDE